MTTLKRKAKRPIDLRKARMKAIAKSPEAKKMKDAIMRDLYLWAT